MKCEIYKVKKGKLRGQWRWRVRASNGKITASGESYLRKGSMLNVLERMLASMPIVDVTDPEAPRWVDRRR